MVDTIEKLLILQDRDRKILKLRDELARVQPERTALQGKTTATQAALDSVKNRQKLNETARKDLEGDVVAKKQMIEKYSLQQFQTKKNDEYRALGKEIEHCKELISKIEDQQIEVMEQAEGIQKEVQAAAQIAAEAKKAAEAQLQGLTQREAALKKELADLESNRHLLTAPIDAGLLNRYERLLKTKGGNAVVGVSHSVCGGCHMGLPAQVVVTSQARMDMVSCPNCGRLLFYSSGMDLAAAD